MGALSQSTIYLLEKQNKTKTKTNKQKPPTNTKTQLESIILSLRVRRDGSVQAPF